MSGPPFAVAGDIYRVQVALGTGTISGGAMDELTVRRFRFELDCQNFSFIGCTNEGDIIRYISDATITDTNCVDSLGKSSARRGSTRTPSSTPPTLMVAPASTTAS